MWLCEIGIFVKRALWFGLLDHRGRLMRMPSPVCHAYDCSICYVRCEASPERLAAPWDTVSCSQPEYSVCSCLARRPFGPKEGLYSPVAFSIGVSDCFRAGFWLPGKWRWTWVAVVCSQTWPGDLLFHFLGSNSGLGSTVGPRRIHVGEAAGPSAVGGLAGQR